MSRTGEMRTGPSAPAPASTAPARRSSWARLTLALATRAARHPSLAVDLARVAWRFRDRRWYARFPFLPIPSAPYVRWRMHTAYGDSSVVPPADDVVRYARWVGREL